MKNCKLINLKGIGNTELGYLVPIEYKNNIDFDIKRAYYTYNVPSTAERGNHAHKSLFQLFICIAGSITVECFNGIEKEVYNLNSPSQGLIVGPMIWREMYNYSIDTRFLVLASDYYDEKDYIRDYDEFLMLSNKEQLLNGD